MINANELRVNNWYLLGTDYFKLDLDSFENVIVFKTVDRLSPIPLTAEILEKAGFEAINGEYILKLSETGIELVQTCFMDLWLIRYNNSEVPLDDERLQYLHQLQTLHFALTGEELKINFQPEAITG